MKDKLKQFILFGACSALALAICMAVLVVTVKNLENDSGSTQATIIENKTQLGNSKADKTDYLMALVNATAGELVKTKTYTSVSVNDLVVTDLADKAQSSTDLFNFVKDKILPVVDSFYPADKTGTFAENNSTKLLLVVNNKSIVNAGYSIGQVNEKGESVYDDSGKLVDEEYYYLAYTLNVDNVLNSKAQSKALGLYNDIKAKSEFISAVKGNCNITDFNAQLTEITLNLKVNRTNDQIVYLDVVKEYSVTFTAEFVESLSALGKKAVAFNYSVTDTYEYSYCGISFTENQITINRNEEYVLNVNAVIDNDSEYTVEFISADDSIVTVDEMGYVKGISASNAPVTITVRLCYLGESFTDTCTVNVTDKNGGA